MFTFLFQLASFFSFCQFVSCSAWLCETGLWKCVLKIPWSGCVGVCIMIENIFLNNFCCFSSSSTTTTLLFKFINSFIGVDANHIHTYKHTYIEYIKFTYKVCLRTKIKYLYSKNSSTNIFWILISEPKIIKLKSFGIIKLSIWHVYIRICSHMPTHTYVQTYETSTAVWSHPNSGWS